MLSLRPISSLSVSGLKSQTRNNPPPFDFWVSVENENKDLTTGCLTVLSKEAFLGGLKNERILKKIINSETWAVICYVDKDLVKIEIDNVTYIVRLFENFTEPEAPTYTATPAISPRIKNTYREKKLLSKAGVLAIAGQYSFLNKLNLSDWNVEDVANGQITIKTTTGKTFKIKMR